MVPSNGDDPGSDPAARGGGDDLRHGRHHREQLLRPAPRSGDRGGVPRVQRGGRRGAHHDPALLRTRARAVGAARRPPGTPPPRRHHAHDHGARPGRRGAEPGAGRPRVGRGGRRADQRGRADPGAVRRAPRPRRRAGQDDLDGDVGPARRGAALPRGGGRGGRAAGLAGGVRARRRAHRRRARRAVAGAAGARTQPPGCATPRCCARCSPSCARSPCCAGGSSTARRPTRRSARCGRASASCSPGRRTACPRA